MKNTYMVIPAYEPDKNLYKVVVDIRQLWFERHQDLSDLKFIIVDDGSSPDKAEIFERLTKVAHVIHHDVNKGKGAALKTALRYIKDAESGNSDESIIITVDADGQHKAQDVLNLKDTCLNGDGGLYLGSRRFTGKVPLRSLFGNTVTRSVFRFVTGTYLYDTQTGLRAFTTSLSDFMCSISGERYEYEMNVLLKCTENRIKITEMPIDTVYENNNESSHFDTVKDSFRIYRVILGQVFRFGGSSFVSFLLDYALFALFGAFGLSIVASNVSARVFSSAFNFSVNRKYVFGKKESLTASLIKYMALAVFILVCGTCVLYFMNSYLGIERHIAKLITETLMFMVSWSIQKTFVFEKQDIKKIKTEKWNQKIQWIRKQLRFLPYQGVKK